MTDEQVNRLAYRIWQERGCKDNEDEICWAEAVRRLKEAEAQPAPPIHKKQTILQRWLAGTLKPKPLRDREKP